MLWITSHNSWLSFHTCTRHQIFLHSVSAVKGARATTLPSSFCYDFISSSLKYQMRNSRLQRKKALAPGAPGEPSWTLSCFYLGMEWENVFRENPEKIDDPVIRSGFYYYNSRCIKRVKGLWRKLSKRAQHTGSQYRAYGAGVTVRESLEVRHLFCPSNLPTDDKTNLGCDGAIHCGGKAVRKKIRQARNDKKRL